MEDYPCEKVRLCPQMIPPKVGQGVKEHKAQSVIHDFLSLLSVMLGFSISMLILCLQKHLQSSSLIVVIKKLAHFEKNISHYNQSNWSLQNWSLGKERCVAPVAS